MDIVLLVLLALAFVGLISILDVPLAWSLVLVVFLALIYIGIRHPHGRKDWKMDLKVSLYFIVTAFLLIVMLYVMYLASGALRFPPFVTMTLWLAIALLLLLSLLSLFFPDGWKSAKRA